MIIEAKDYQWKYCDKDAPPRGRYLPGIFRIPEGVIIRFPNGEEYDSTGGPDGRNLEGTTMEGSPVHQALVDAGLSLERVQ